MNKIKNWIIFVFFFAITAIFFFKGFFGYAIQGGDGAYWSIKTLSSSLKETLARFSDTSWIGFQNGNVTLSVILAVIKIFPSEWVSVIHYFIVVFFTLLFSYLLLRKNSLSIIASIFGSIAYAFTPPFLTTIYSGHAMVMDMLFLPPLLFYLISCIFAEKKNKLVLNFIYILLAGSAWGIMMSDDVQRGLYFSVLLAAYIIILIYKKNNIYWKTFFHDISRKTFLVDILKIFLVGIILFLSFFNGLTSWIEPLKSRIALQETQNSSSEQNKWNFATSWSFNPTELVDNFAFGFHGTISGDQNMPYWGTKEYSGNSEAIGFFVILLGIFGFLVFRKSKPIVWFFMISFIILVLLSFGRFWPGKPLFWLFYHIPMMSNFRAPSKFISVAAFFISILSAFGIEYFIQSLKVTKPENPALNLLLKTLFFSLCFEIVVVFFVLIGSNDITLSLGEIVKNPGIGSILYNNITLSLLRLIIFTFLSLLCIVLIYQISIKRIKSLPQTISNNIPIIFILLCLFDLWSINWYYMDKAYFKINDFYKPDNVITGFQKDYQKEIFRVETSLLVPTPNGIVQPYQITSLKSYYLTYMFPYFDIQPMDVTVSLGVKDEYNDFFMANLKSSLTKPLQNINDLIDINIKLMRMANVKYLIFDGLVSNTNLTLTNILKGYDNYDHAIYYLHGYLPRVGFYENYQCVDKEETSLKMIAENKYDIKKTVLLQSDNPSQSISSNSVIPLNIIVYKPWRIQAELNEKMDGAVLLTTKYSPSWKAYLDGKKIPVYRANYLEIGALVNKRAKIIEFRFEPDTKPFWISFITVISGLVLLLVYAIWRFISALKNREVR